MSQIIRINMGELNVTAQEAPPEFVKLGGRALTSYVIATEVPPTCHPLSSANKLIFAPGLLAGSAAPNSGRLSVGAKSPLTEGVKETNVGGTAAQRLGRLGIKAIILEGEPAEKKFYVIKVESTGVRIIAAEESAGLGNYDAVAQLQSIHGEKVSILSIGSAGEMKLAAASVACTDPEGRPSRHAARGGLGAVMGSKGVKAIVIDDTGSKMPEPHDKAAFKEICKEYIKEIKELKATQLISQFGTVGGLSYLSKVGALPTRNYKVGSFEGNDRIGGKGVAALNASRGGSFGHVCMPGCVVRCSNVMHDKEGKFLTAGFEFESSAMLGANLGIDVLDDVLALEKMCDDLGLDTMETGAALGMAAEAGIYDFGDGGRALELLREVGEGTVLGRVIGQGVKVTARVFGISRVPVVKGQAVPAHDPRKEVGSGIGYATNPQGADHTGVIIYQDMEREEMIALSRQKQINTCAYDSVGLCQMAEPTPEIMAKLISSFYGWQWRTEDVEAMGQAVLKREVSFNREAGLGPATDRLPDFFKEEALEPTKGVFDMTEAEIGKVLNLE
jgi:aldehyde:ferredoxin oxidoreductase